jgi:hypothetical protein
MTLSEKLLKTPEVEKSGSLATQRLEYQAQWALTLVFDIHVKSEDYAIAVEFHDDVAVLDNSISPNSIKFYQVKTSTKAHWTVPALFTRDKGKDGARLPSYIGKLYANYLRFGEFSESASFVSNIPCKVTPAGASSASFADIAPEHQKVFMAKINEEYPSLKLNDCKALHFIESDLSLKDASGHLKGKLTDFIEEVVGGDAVYQPSSLYLLMTDEFRRRAIQAGTYSSIPELLQKKAVTKADVNSWLDTIRTEKNHPKWEDVSGHLNLPAMKLADMRRSWKRYEAEVLDSGNIALNRVRDVIRKEQVSSAYTSLDFDDYLSQCFLKVSAGIEDIMPGVSDSRVKVMILYEMMCDD